MPSRTDTPSRTKPQISVTPASPLVASPASSPARQVTADPELTHETFQSIPSSLQRAGRWEVADEIEVRAFFGAVVLDFTHADLPPSGMIEIDALSFCGSIEIIVPDGAEIELDGTPIVGSIEQKLRKRGAGEAIRERIAGGAQPAGSSETPYFRIEGHAIFGSIEVIGR